MKKGFYVPSVRPKSLFKLLKSIRQLNVIQDWDIYLYLQCYSNDERDKLRGEYGDMIEGMLITNERVAPYVARRELMNHFPSDIYCLNDDDAVMLNMVNYETPVQFLLENRLAGMISTNWVRVNTEKMMARKRYEDVFVKQKLVNTGGGLIFRNDILKNFREDEIQPYLYDDIAFALQSYILGYDNYRYLGSIIEHNAVMKGGIKTLYKEREMCLLPEDLIEMKPTTDIYPHKNNNYHMPTQRDLTQLAHRLHRENNAYLQKAERI